MRPLKTINSLEVKSAGSLFNMKLEEPNIATIHDLKKKVGARRYRSNIRKSANIGNKSIKKLKNNISETNIIEPGKPKNTSVFNKATKNSLGHKKFKPLISVISLVLNRLATASTNKNEFVDNKAWLISIEKLANIRAD